MAAPRGPLSVAELNRRAKTLLEAHLELLWVAGEISNFTRAASGHCYFSLKDESAQVRCVMFRNRVAALGFALENGMKVEVRALPSLYEPRGEFQLGVENVRRAGLGNLFEAYEKLKAALRAEGLFDEAVKRPIPVFPRRIGVVTSLAAAALRDILTVLARRAPMIPIVIYPAAVQGSGAAAEIAAAIDQARIRNEVDILLVCRGGGSIEDLWSFNSEAVARALARLRAETAMASVSGVGHETDFTIADFAADRRAPTPSAAAELASPDREALIDSLRQARLRARRALRRALDQAAQHLDWARRGLQQPTERLAIERGRLGLARERLRGALSRRAALAALSLEQGRLRLAAAKPDPQSALADCAARRRALDLALQTLLARASERFTAQARALSHLDPLQVLERGYGIVEHDGRLVRDPATLRPGDRIGVRVARGRFNARVDDAT